MMKNLLSKKLLTLLSLLLVLVLLAACTPAATPDEAPETPAADAEEVDEPEEPADDVEPEEPADVGEEAVTITFSVNVQPQLPLEFWQGIADAYMAENPHVTVELLPNPGAGVTIFEHQATLLATGQFPDVMVMQNPADFVPAGALYPFELDFLDFIEEPTVGMIGGNQYVANYKKQVIGVFYNRDMFEEHGWSVPETYAEFIALCEAIEAEGILPVSMGIRDGWPQIMLANMIAGTELLAANPGWGARRNADEVQFDNPDLIRAFERYQEIVQRFSGPHVAALSYTEMLEQFFNGTAAMLPMGSWVNADIYALGDDFNAGWFPMPGENDANVLSVFINEGLSVGATDNNQHPEVAKDFVRFFFTNEQVMSDFLFSEQLFWTTVEKFPFQMSPLRQEIGEMIIGMQFVEGFESMTGDDAFLPGLKDYFTNVLTQNIAMGNDVQSELQAFDAEWERANAALD